MISNKLVLGKPNPFKKSFFCLLRCVSVAANAIQFVVQNLLPIIRQNSSEHPSIGVDVEREERFAWSQIENFFNQKVYVSNHDFTPFFNTNRHQKALDCFNQLLTIKSFVLKQQCLSGETGSHFRQLATHLEKLDRKWSLSLSLSSSFRGFFLQKALTLFEYLVYMIFSLCIFIRMPNVFHKFQIVKRNSKHGLVSKWSANPADQLSLDASLGLKHCVITSSFRNDRHFKDWFLKKFTSFGFLIEIKQPNLFIKIVLLFLYKISKS